VFGYSRSQIFTLPIGDIVNLIEEWWAQAEAALTNHRRIPITERLCGELRQDGGGPYVRAFDTGEPKRHQSILSI
jgi:hypothetical protein